jgi:hypothetical protein
MIVGAIVGGVVGAVASGLAVAAVDRHDNDNTITGIGKDNDWDKHDPDWRGHYEQKYSSTGATYDNDYQHAYRYGHDLSQHKEYIGRNWEDVEADAKRDWEASNPGTWDTYRAPIRDSWDRGRSLVSTQDGTSSYAYADAPGIQTGGHNADGSPDTRGITEKVADTVTGDKYDDKTGKRTD